MGSHWNGLVSGFPIALISTATVLISIVAFIFLSIIASFIAAGVQAKRRGFLTTGQVTDAVDEQIRKVREAWTCPPELNLPVPRPVRSASLAIRLLRSVPQLLWLAIFGTIFFTIGFMRTHDTPHLALQELFSFLYRRFLDFLSAPSWDSWMLGPTIALAVVAAITFFVGHFKRRREKQLLAWGLPARAMVTSTFTSRHTGEVLHLEYSDASGNTIRSAITSDSFPHAPREVFTILYDPKSPLKLIPYPVSRYVIDSAHKP